jgi:hypothetical protein
MVITSINFIFHFLRRCFLKSFIFFIFVLFVVVTFKEEKEDIS